MLSLCAKALDARKQELKLSDLALKERTAQTVELTKQVEDQEAALNAWYRNPWFLIGIGLLGGVVIAK